mmetsp:Transcript_26531/g.48578  ORF Transcript_26531/g.48578 Transcript_26531/m.48578 type:complete len:817 (-) Transcript_26531:3-2453(-)
MEKAASGMRDIFSAFTASEARYFDEERYSEAELRRALSDSLTDSKIDAMKRILAAVSVGRDASPLFRDVVMNVEVHSLELKKLVYIYLVQYAEHNTELALLSINSFHKDLSDRSQLVRASALRAMASIKVLEVIQLVMVAVKSAANDSSAYVRKTAAQCMTKVYAADPDQFSELRSLLLKLMSDQDVQVVGSAVMAFHHMCILKPPASPDAEAGTSSGSGATSSEIQKAQLMLLHQHYRRLCQNLVLMDSWAQQVCIDLLLRYCRLFFAAPTAEGLSQSASSGQGGDSAVAKDLLSFLQVLKMLLNSASRGVTLAAGVALCYLSPPEEIPVIVRPLLRCLRQTPAESLQGMLTAMVPIVEARPNLIRPHLKEFFVQSFDLAGIKELKLRFLQKLVDESNVQMVLRELQTYVSWHSHPVFVGQAVQSIAQVALKVEPVADQCLRGLVKMLDSKCEAVSSEAVVAVRALLQHRHASADSGLGSVLPHLVRYLDDLRAANARASVVWIIGQYQREVMRLAPDVLRKLAKSFTAERQEVKQQILVLGFKVWSMHYVNSTREAASDESQAEGKLHVSPAESVVLLPRLELLTDYIFELASFDATWDVRDTARVLQQLKSSAKDGCGQQAFEEFSRSYMRVCADGEDLEGKAEATVSETEGLQQGESALLKSTWTLGSMSQALDFQVETYRPLPPWAEEDSPDDLRVVKAAPAPKPAQSLSSSNYGNSEHFENRVQNPSNITEPLPQVATMSDLDKFYSESKPAKEPVRSPQAPAPTAQTPVGIAIFGEDEESDEEADPESDAEDDWKYCQQASKPPQGTGS